MLKKSQKTTISHINKLLEKLEQLQSEEGVIRKQIDEKRQEVDTMLAAQQSLRERLHHCEMAIEVLNSL